MESPNSNDIPESPMHLAASTGDIDEVLALICQGFDVNVARSRDGKTPLMLAVMNNSPDVVTALLATDADIDATDDNDESALRMVFRQRNTHPAIIEGFLHVISKNFPTPSDVDALVDRLHDAGCTLYHATFLANRKLMEGLWARGVNNIDQTYFKGRSALHIATDMDQLSVVGFLLYHGANVNVLDDDGCGALCIASANGNEMIVQWLLERGADPNVQAFEYKLSPLIAAMENSDEETERQHDQCAEILLQYGAVPTQKIGDYPTIFDEALDNESFYRINMLICHVALNDLQTSALSSKLAETILQCKSEEHRYAIAEFRMYYENCWRTLETKICGSVSLLDLLTVDERKMRLFARNRRLRGEIAEFCREREIGKLYPYYFNTLQRRLTDAVRVVELEDSAVVTVCEMLGCELNGCYFVARNVVSYLGSIDLEMLCEVRERYVNVN